MKLIDVNILLYAEDVRSKFHEAALTWWDELLSGTEQVALSWLVLSAYIRIGTNPRLYPRPLTIQQATDRVQGWLDQPCVRIIQPGAEHWRLFQQMLTTARADSKLVTDAQLAALAIEHNCVLYSADEDFAKFKGLRWQNPLKT